MFVRRSFAKRIFKYAVYWRRFQLLINFLLQMANKVFHLSRSRFCYLVQRWFKTGVNDPFTEQLVMLAVISWRFHIVNEPCNIGVFLAHLRQLGQPMEKSLV